MTIVKTIQFMQIWEDVCVVPEQTPALPTVEQSQQFIRESRELLSRSRALRLEMDREHPVKPAEPDTPDR